MYIHLKPAAFPVGQAREGVISVTYLRLIAEHLMVATYAAVSRGGIVVGNIKKELLNSDSPFSRALTEQLSSCPSSDVF